MASQRVKLITRNLQEVLGESRIETILKERELKVYWGTAPTGKPHLGYFVPLSKIADFLSAGCHVTILVADLHAYLDNMKAPWELLEHRTSYYENLIKAVLRSINVPLEKLNFVRGTSYQLDKKYVKDVYRLSSLVSLHDAKKAGAEVVKQVDNPMLSGLLYPGLQALDEEYLGVDAQFGGVDQRKIFTFAEKYMPILGYEKRIHLMNPMVPGLAGSKMSSSDPDSKIDLLDDEATVKRKINRSFCEPGNVEQNGLLAFARYVLFPVRTLKGLSEQITIERKPEHGGNLTLNGYDELENLFKCQKLYPLDLKNFIAQEINELLDPVRKEFTQPHLLNLTKAAYPMNVPVSVAMSDDFGKLSLKVGSIEESKPHPESDQLLVLTVNIGEEKPRQVVAKLAPYFTPGSLVEKRIVLVSNLKASKFKGMESNGMILAAASNDGSKVELVIPPEASPVGSSIVVDGIESEPETVLNPKKKILETVLESMTTLKITDSIQVVYRDESLQTIDGPCTVQSIINGKIK